MLISLLNYKYMAEEHGKCCCNCKNQLKLMKHPMNVVLGEGSITEQLGWVCAAQFEDGSNEGESYFMDNEHGMCEFYKPKTN
jgi:hypothetical protein